MDNKKNALFYHLARPAIREIEAYDPGPMPADAQIRISANENNMGVPEKAREALLRALDEGNRYPESRCAHLRELLAERHSVAPEQIVIGNGLDGIFTMLGRAFMEPGDEILCGELTFSVYEDTARVMGATPVLVPLTEAYALDAEGFTQAVTGKTKMIFFCNPNNPTGTIFPIAKIEEMLGTIPQNVLFVLDEAYLEFADDPIPSGIPLLEKYPNLIVCRTFSKIYGIAGLRVGYAIADPELLHYLYKVRETYAVSALSAAAAEGALQDTEYHSCAKRLVQTERKKICDFFERLQISYIPSQANFVTIFAGPGAVQIRDALLARGIVLRLLTYKDKKEMLRVSVGLPEENRIFMEAFEAVSQ